MTLYPLRDDTCLLALPMHEGEGNIFYDHSRYSHNATFYGDTLSWTDSPFGKCLHFPGTEGYYAKIGNAHEILEKIKQTNEITITAWINTAEDGQILYDCGCSPPVCGGFELRYQNGGKIYFEANSANTWRVETSDSFADGVWHFVAIEGNDEISRILVDGEIKAEAPYRGYKFDYFNCDYVFYLGWDYNSNYFDGFICNFRIYNRFLSSDEIKALELYYRNFEVRPSILCPRPTL